jgi:hypothetical protein
MRTNVEIGDTLSAKAMRKVGAKRGVAPRPA